MCGEVMKRILNNNTVTNLLDDKKCIKFLKLKNPKLVILLFLISMLLFILSIILLNDISLRLFGIGIMLFGIVLLILLKEKQ